MSVAFDLEMKSSRDRILGSLMIESHGPEKIDISISHKIFFFYFLVLAGTIYGYGHDCDTKRFWINLI